MLSLHKLSAGDGYTYLTRQVAAQDVTHRGRASLGEYYAERGESPGVWLGRGAAGLPGFAGGQVREEQMVALFGEGRHPDADRIERDLIGAGHGVPVALAATRLGASYRTYGEGRSGRFADALAARAPQVNVAAGRLPGAPLGPAERARVRTELAGEWFSEEFGRAPRDAVELAGFVARVSRRSAAPVAGYDLTFTPVKSVSALWALADPVLAKTVEGCHDAAVRDALGWLEENAGFTRLGRNGVRQVPVVGLIAAAFVHRDSRAGDPNLHTHVAVSNKVQVAEALKAGVQGGQWGALDGRPLHALTVASAERYTTRLEVLLGDRLGVVFADRPGGRPGVRPVREVVGVDPALLRAWSSRRAAVAERQAGLVGVFQAEHGRPPTPLEAVPLAQQATLETRPGKHAPRSEAEQRLAWRVEAEHALGGPGQVQQMLTVVLGRGHERGAVDPAATTDVSAGWFADTADRVVEAVQASRATWKQSHLRAEAERQVRAARLPLGLVDDAVERVVAAALSSALSVPLSPPADADAVLAVPPALLRADGSSVFRTAGSDLYTSTTLLAAERSLLHAAERVDGHRVPRPVVERVLRDAAMAGERLNEGQWALVRELAGSGRRLQLALAPAGSGKTTALRQLALAWEADGGCVVAVAPSAAAAAVLGERLPAPAETLAKLIHSLGLPTDRQPEWARQVGPGTLLLVDEAGMSGTLDLARAMQFVLERGGSCRLVGDDQQLAAVAAGGVLRDLARLPGATASLQEVVRFADVGGRGEPGATGGGPGRGRLLPRPRPAARR